MADLQKAWGITKNFEGEWTDYDHKLTDKSDEGNFFPFGQSKKPNYVGTNFGCTAAFADNYIDGWHGMTVSGMYKKMSGLSEADLQNSFGRTKWEWCAGDRINNQSIANLLFDFCIMADQKMIQVVAQALMKPIGEISTVKKIRNTTDGWRILNSTAVDAINNYPDQKKLFNIIKTGYMAYHIKKNSVQAIKNRVNSFQYSENKQAFVAESFMRQTIVTDTTTKPTNFRERFRAYRLSVIQEKQEQKWWWYGLGGLAVIAIGWAVYYFFVRKR